MASPAAGVSSPGPSSPLLTRAVSGTAAVRALGSNLDAAASRNRMTPERLRGLLTSDTTVRLDKLGHIFYTEETPPAPGSAATAGSKSASGAYPYSQTFQLHSDPGAQRVLYLDFLGYSLEGTRWDNGSPALDGTQTGLDTDGDPTTFSLSEQDIIQSVWARVAEDYSPFEVDVTTQDPGTAALVRSSASDEAYGQRVVMINAPAVGAAVCPSACGGIAYYYAFASVVTSHSQDEPALVFLDTMYNDPKNIGEAASHETGHTLGLSHDGTSSLAYYAGQAAWAPIMGTGYTRPIVQFSAGEYAGANNGQNDLAVIAANGAPLRLDDHGDTSGDASLLSFPVPAPVSGRISTRDDVDMFELDRPCSGAFSAAATVSAVSPDLDAKLSLYSATGELLASADPTSAMVNAYTASGLSASLATTLAPGTYYLAVDGVGAGSPVTNGYSDYASLGLYTLTASGCPGIVVPAAPVDLADTVNTSAHSVTLSWAPPASVGASAITGYRVARDGSDAGGGGPWSTTVSADTHARTFLNLIPGKTYNLSVQAINGDGQGAAAAMTVALGTDIPSVPGSISVAQSAKTRVATLHWTPPRVTGGSTITGYRVIRGGHDATGKGPLTKTVSAATRTIRFTRLKAGATYAFSVQAITSKGRGTAASISVRVLAKVPSAVRSPKTTQNVSTHSVKLSWAAPASTGGSRITGYRVRRGGFDADGHGPVSVVVSASARSYTFAKLNAGQTYALYVQPLNASGGGREVELATTVSGGFPSKPLEVTAVQVATDAVTLSWFAPSSAGASALNAYRVARDGNDVTGAGPWSMRIGSSLHSETFTGLLPGETYELSVQAVNAAGPGPAVTITVTLNP